ncbi:MAG: RagB/SusD family nutrient uptake outer membrane protein [Tannerellaceae bacterium]|nr:RagB/SusD family nutrient uptake outer membrane protein [Tannerellaceae bacterium]
MNRLFVILLLSLILTGINSCDNFLEMPEVTGNVYLDDVFSTRKDAEGMLFAAYHLGLKHGLPESWGSTHGTIASISGELTRGYSWHPMYKLVQNGPNIAGEDYQSNAAGSEIFENNWRVIRRCYIIIDNIHKVEDMSDRMKEFVRGEAYGLIAYRYMGMFYRFGGLPIVRQANNMDDDLAIPRESVQNTLDFILESIDEAYKRVPDSWVDIEPGDGEKWVGRLTKGAVLAMKARLLIFAARPLFNSETPYTREYNINFPGENEELIWIGGYSEQRWQEAIQANLAVLQWAKNNNKRLIFSAGEGNRNTFSDAIKDYGHGVSQLNGPEILLAYKIANTQVVANNMNMAYNFSNYVEVGEKAQIGMLTNFLRLYRDRDGGEIDWPRVGEAAPRPISDFGDNIDKIEARFRVDMCVPGKFTASNDGHANWNENMQYLASFTTNATVAENMTRAQEGRAVGSPTKFYFEAGARVWLEFPLFRLAENYIHLAEAYNEVGNTIEALRYLNIIRNRAGLPSISVTDKNQLRAEIQREKALEFFFENHRFFDVKFWKHPDIGTNILGGPKYEISFLRIGNLQTMDALVSYWDAYSFTGFWHPKWFLEPFLQSEVNKGILVQNPGY